MAGVRQKSKSQRWTRSKKRIEYFCLPNLHRYDFHFFVELSPKTDRTVGFQGYDLRFRVGITSILAEGAVPGNRQTQWNWLFHSQSARFLSWQAQYLVNLQCCFEWYDASGQQNVAYGHAREGLQERFAVFKPLLHPISWAKVVKSACHSRRGHAVGNGLVTLLDCAPQEADVKRQDNTSPRSTRCKSSIDSLLWLDLWLKKNQPWDTKSKTAIRRTNQLPIGGPWLCLYLSIHPSIHPTNQPTIHPSIRPSIHPSIDLSVCLSIYLSI